jgi:extracellular matrix protein 14
MRLRGVLFVVSFAVISPVSHAARLGSLVPHRDTPSDEPTQNERALQLFPLLTWVRDELVELFFGSPPRKLDKNQPIRDGYLTKYADDIVLRFNLTTLEEEAALSEATSRLFLDIWSFAEEYVDIRIRKQNVHSLLSLLPISLQTSHSTLIPDLASLIRNTYPSKYSALDHHRSQDGPVPLKAASPDDNLFFQDYQSLPVSFL